MKLASFLKDSRLRSDSRAGELLAALEGGGFELCEAVPGRPLSPGTEMLLSLGGDGTYLSAARIACEAGVPVLGVNFGRLGFLSENQPDAVVSALLNKDYTIRRSTLLKLECASVPGEPLALNEVCVMRDGPAMLGIDVSLDGLSLPTYWADGLIVATSSGSTAYSLSVGGPICMPDSRVLVVAPVSPHNLGVRPLVVPDGTRIGISFRSRSSRVRLTADELIFDIPASESLTVSALPGALGRVVLGGSNFIQALRSRLHWGSDVRNNPDLQ